MNRSLPVFILGLIFNVAGLFLVFHARDKQKAAASAPAPRKSDLRDLAIQKQNNSKMRVAGGILAVFGSALMLLSWYA